MDPTYVTIALNTTSVGATLSSLNIFLVTLPLLLLLGAIAIIFVISIISFLIGIGSFTNRSQQQVQTQTSQQTQQQNSNQKQANTVSIDLRTLNNAKDGIFFGIIIIILIIFAAFTALGSATNVLQYGVVTFLIIVLSILAIAVLYDSFKSLKTSLPKKIKKIIKKTIIYEDGSTEEREEKYEC